MSVHCILLRTVILCCSVTGATFMLDIHRHMVNTFGQSCLSRFRLVKSMILEVQKSTKIHQSSELCAKNHHDAPWILNLRVGKLFLQYICGSENFSAWHY